MVYFPVYTYNLPLVKFIALFSPNSTSGSTTSILSLVKEKPSPLYNYTTALVALIGLAGSVPIEVLDQSLPLTTLSAEV